MFNCRSFVLFAFVLAIMANLGCSGSSLSPSPEGSLPSVVQPFPGTSVLEVVVPGATDPIRVWITALSPPKFSQLSVGQRVSATFSIVGPSGYEALIASDFMSGDISAESSVTATPCDQWGASNWYLGPRPDGTQGMWMEVSDNTPTITDIRFRIWYHPRGSAEWSKCADAVVKESVGLLSPR